MDRILILDANQRSALAATRSLGVKGLTVITADSTHSTLAGASRFAAGHALYPSPHTDPQAFIAALVALVEHHRIDVLLPMTDVSTALVLQHRAHLPHVRIPFPDLEGYDLLTDKLRLSALARELGIRSPVTLKVPLPGDPDSQDPFDDLPFPAVVKPAQSKWRCGDRWVSAKVQYVDSIAALGAAVARARMLGPIPLLAQECIAGQGQGIFCLYDSGRPHSFFSHRRLREKPPSGGVSVLSESIAIDERMRAMSETLLSHAGWHGVAMAEFKVTSEGTPYLIEVNGRFWGSLQLAIDAGMDFPYMLYRLAKGEPTDPVRDFEIGARLRWLLGDLDHLYLTLKASGTKGGWRHKLQAMRDFLVLFQPRLRYETNRLHDMGPFLLELRRYFLESAHT